jgi:hypothetical protein
MVHESVRSVGKDIRKSVQVTRALDLRVDPHGLHGSLCPDRVLPVMDHDLISAAQETLPDDLVLLRLQDPQQPEARLTMGTARTLDERLPHLTRSKLPAVLDEPGDAEHLAAKPRILRREGSIHFEPVAGIDDEHREPIALHEPVVSLGGIRTFDDPAEFLARARADLPLRQQRKRFPQATKRSLVVVVGRGDDDGAGFAGWSPVASRGSGMTSIAYVIDVIPSL